MRTVSRGLHLEDLPNTIGSLVDFVQKLCEYTHKTGGFRSEACRFRSEALEDFVRLMIFR